MIYVYPRGRLLSFARAFRLKKPRNIQIWCSSSPSLKKQIQGVGGSRFRPKTWAGTLRGHCACPHFCSRDLLPVTVAAALLEWLACPPAEAWILSRLITSWSFMHVPFSEYVDFHWWKGKAWSSPREQQLPRSFNSPGMSALGCLQTEGSSRSLPMPLSSIIFQIPLVHSLSTVAAC